MAHPMVNRFRTIHTMADLQGIADAEFDKLTAHSDGTDRHGRWLCFQLTSKISKEIIEVLRSLAEKGMELRVLEGDLIMAPTLGENGIVWNPKKSRKTRPVATVKVKVPLSA